MPPLGLLLCLDLTPSAVAFVLVWFTCNFVVKRILVHFLHCVLCTHMVLISVVEVEVNLLHVVTEYIRGYCSQSVTKDVQWNLSNAVSYGPDIFGLIIKVPAIQMTCIKRPCEVFV